MEGAGVLRNRLFLLSQERKREERVWGQLGLGQGKDWVTVFFLGLIGIFWEKGPTPVRDLRDGFHQWVKGQIRTKEVAFHSHYSSLCEMFMGSICLTENRVTYRSLSYSKYLINNTRMKLNSSARLRGFCSAKTIWFFSKCSYCSSSQLTINT